MTIAEPNSPDPITISKESPVANDVAIKPGASPHRTERSQPAHPMRAWLGREAVRQNISLLLVLVGLSAIFGSLRHDVFLTPINLRNIAAAGAILAVVSVGQTLVILSGGLDISVGSITGLSAVCAAYMMNEHAVGPVGGIVTALLVGLLAGTLNGVLISYVGINPVITTLGTLSALKGIAFLVAGGKSIPILERGYTAINRLRPLGVPVPVVIAIGVGVVFAFVLQSTDWGRNIYAMGGNEVAARLSGIPVLRYRAAVYAISGLTAGLAGVLLSAKTQNGIPESGSAGLELASITAVVLGGAALTGGKGSVLSTVLGVLMIEFLRNGLTVMNVQTFYQQVATGTLLVLAVGVQVLRSRRSERVSSRAALAETIEIGQH